MRTSSVGIALITEFEGFPNGGRPYNDPVGFATVGYGHLIGRRRVNEHDRHARWLAHQRSPGKLTLAEGRQLLSQDLEPREDAVDRLVKVPMSPGQFDALVSLVYNIGEDAFARSTVLRRLNERDYRGAADALLMWNKAGSPPRVFAGLDRRRRAERARFLANGTGVRAGQRRLAGFTESEVRWIEEYDRLQRARRNPERQVRLREEMTRQRKKLWRLAQPAAKGGDGQGWDHANRRARYRALLRRTQ